MSITDFFTLSPEWQRLLVRFAGLLVISVTIVWLYAVARLYFSKGAGEPLKVRQRTSLIEGSLAGIFVLSVMMLALVYVTGWRRFVWDVWTWRLATNTYLMLLPEIVMFVALSVFFFIQRKKLLNLLNTK